MAHDGKGFAMMVKSHNWAVNCSSSYKRSELEAVMTGKWKFIGNDHRSQGDLGNDN